MDEERDVLGEETPMEDSETVSGGDDLFDGESWSDGEVEESTPPVEEVVTAAAAVEEKTERDFTGEALALLQAYPRLRGQRLPDEVLVECAKGTQLLAAYRAYEARALESVREDNRVLRQNAEALRRAPVSAVSGGGVREEPTDPFLDGFDMED